MNVDINCLSFVVSRGLSRQDEGERQVLERPPQQQQGAPKVADLEQQVEDDRRTKRQRVVQPLDADQDYERCERALVSTPAGAGAAGNTILFHAGRRAIR